MAGTVVMNYMFNLHGYLKDDPAYKRLHMIAGVVLMLSGFFNIFLIKGKKKLKPEHKPWSTMLKLKLVIALLFTPLINPLLSGMTSTEEELAKLRINIQFYLLIGMFIYSTFIKYYREEICNNFDDDEVFKKVQELQKKYEKGDKELIRGVPRSDEQKSK
ncbi:UNKNOWN [Stylonychia lemnae]|uniref:Uncharacterized protein n=1 Tax=Stylonychia lemnae TaxID=5949 RepID=A0A078B1J1_STYLE|nr:UNKNOWN [Stylonychia lemnae]|eukprot:CDW88176.1 UNKNOWN [Stylonychia lemnae]